jgi:hypothetical protein
MVMFRNLMKDWKESNLNITKEFFNFLNELFKSDTITN